jgi:hypothetical protein
MSNETGRIEKLLAQAKSDTEEKTSISEAECELADSVAAERVYRHLCEKLFRIDLWNNESGAMGFTLLNINGEETPEKTADVGDFIRISLPGTGKYDWVKITSVDENPTETILTVQPTFDPTENSANKSITSHFFTDASTNNFCLRLDDKKIKMYVIGLNEETNTDDASNFIESARNLATANLGHYLGFQKAAWMTFCSNFLKNEKETEN